MGTGTNVCQISIVLILISIIGINSKLSVFASELDSSKSSKFICKAPLGIYQKAGVAANGVECSRIGSSMLERNGSAVDAAIAALLCEGIASPQSMGLGGGFFMTIYDSEKNETAFLNARETAPAKAHQRMYEGNANLSVYGGLGAGVPGELMGYWEAHKKYGRLPWKDLFEPAIKLCETGSLVTKYLEKTLRGLQYIVLKEPTLREVLIDPNTNQTYQEDDRIKRPTLAKTLRELANAKNPVELFYNGSIAENLVKEIQSVGGIVTREDFSSYKLNWTKPVELKLVNRTVYSAPAPCSGPLLLFMLNVLQGFVTIDDEKVLWQRIVETIKWSIAKKIELADPAFEDIREVMNQLTSEDYANFIRTTILEDNKTYNDPRHYGINVVNKEDHGTAHISVLAPDGSAVSVTSSINRLLGAKFRSMSTGIIINNQMDDFTRPETANSFGLPTAAKNYIKPFKRPTSSMAPTIVVGTDGNVELVIGASGGTKLISALATIMTFNFWKNYDIKEATDAYRLHPQFFPTEIQNEPDFPSDILNFLQEVGHKTREFSRIGAAATAVARNKGRVEAISDWRRGGTTAGF